jgi:uncharacterized membrane protein
MMVASVLVAVPIAYGIIRLRQTHKEHASARWAVTFASCVVLVLALAFFREVAHQQTLQDRATENAISQ